MKSQIEKILSAHFQQWKEQERSELVELQTEAQVCDFVRQVLREQSTPAGSSDSYRALSPDAQDPLPGGGPLASQLLLRHFHREWEKLMTEARDHAMLKLRILVAQLTERFKATSGWLFFCDDTGSLHARITHHSRQRGFALKIDDRGIVAHVARTRTGYLARDVGRDEHYWEVNKETKSELAVPIIDVDGQLLGVLNLESRLPSQFSDEQIGDLTQAVSCLALHMLVIQNLQACPYHPKLHGWDLSLVLNRLCGSLAAALDEAEGSGQADTSSCTVWYCDHAKGELFVFATSGFDVEYIADDTLPMDSFTGRVAKLARGQVWDTTPENAPRFQRLDKVEISGMKRILATPIYVTGSDPEGFPISTLNVYFLTARPRGSVPSREALATVAAEVGSLVCAYRVQRLRLGRAYLRQQLDQHPQSAAAGCEIVKDVLNEVLEASGCSVFTAGVGPGEDRRLYIATTTGIERGPQDRRDSVAAAEPSYDLDCDSGYTTFVALNPGIAVRKNDVMNEEESGVPAGFPGKPLDKYREKFALSKLDRRRFLGIGVACDDRLLGAIRLNRASTDKPYTRCDAELLEGLVELEECKRALIDHQKQRVRRRQAAAVRPKRLVSVVASFMRPVAIPNVGSVRMLVDQLLQSLLVLFQEHAVEHAGVLVHPSETADSMPRWYARQHRGSARRVQTQRLGEAEMHRKSWAAGERLFTFDDSAIPQVAAGVRVPVIAWTGRRQLKWLLALDFGQAIEWENEHFEILFHATQRLSAILGQSDYVIRPEGLRGPTAVALARLVALTGEHAGIAADGTALRFRYGSEFETVYQVGQSLPNTDEEDWDSIRENEAGVEANLLGVKHWRGGTAWSIPLRLGPFPVGDLRCMFAGKDVEQRRDEVIRTLPVLWSRLACELQTPFGKRPIQFTPDASHQGVTTWQEGLTLPRLNFKALEGKATSADLFSRL